VNAEPPQFLFDECLGRPLTEAMRKLIGFHRHPIGVIHLFDRFPPGTHDEVWVPAIAKENWIVVSVDRGRSPGPKLPGICAQLGVRHILLAPSTACLPQFEKARAFLRVWRDAVNIAQAPAGTRALLKITHGGPMLDPKPPAPGTPTLGLTMEW
jgi:hypothetical protein